MSMARPCSGSRGPWNTRLQATRRVILTNLNAAQHHLLHRQRVFTHTGRLTPAAFSPDGRRLLTTGRSRLGMLWDVESGTLLAEYPLASGRVVAAGFSEGGGAIVVAYQRGSLLVHRLAAVAEAAAEPLAISYS